MAVATIYQTIESSLSTGIFNYVISGGKSLAFVILGVRMLDAWSSNVDFKDKGDILPSIDAVVKVFGSIFIIFASSFIMETIEKAFSNVNSTLAFADSDEYINMAFSAVTFLDEFFESAEMWWDYVGLFFSGLLGVIGAVITILVACLVSIADFVVTIGYLLQRYFIYLFLQFLFPLAVAFSTFPQMENLFWGWVKRYIGVFILGIAYLGVFQAINIIGDVILQLDASDFYGKLAGTMKMLFSCAYIILIFGIKKKLLESVTNFVWSYFN
ncbi:MAG: hypothetical protein RL662_2186 [Bacteroidota bacterium]|jgi:hypothetical protein